MSVEKRVKRLEDVRDEAERRERRERRLGLERVLAGLAMDEREELMRGAPPELVEVIRSASDQDLLRWDSGGVFPEIGEGEPVSDELWERIVQEAVKWHVDLEG